MHKISEQETLSILSTDILKTKIAMEECSDLMISLEAYSDTIETILASDTKVLEANTVNVLNLAFDGIRQSTGLTIHEPIAMESLTDERVSVALEGIIDSISNAIKKTWNALKNSLKSFINKTKVFYIRYLVSVSGILKKLQNLMVKVKLNLNQEHTDKTISVASSILKTIYVAPGSNIPAELVRIGKRIN